MYRENRTQKLTQLLKEYTKNKYICDVCLVCFLRLVAFAKLPSIYISSIAQLIELDAVMGVANSRLANASVIQIQKVCVYS